MIKKPIKRPLVGKAVMSAVAACWLAGCVQKPFPDSPGHLAEPAVTPAQAIPAPIRLEPVKAVTDPLPLLNVSVQNVPANELLFALARDAKVNIDIAPGITGTVSLNAINQTLPQILERLKRQISLRYKLIDGTLAVSSDVPYFVQYSIPYLNLTRSSEGETSIATQVASTGAGAEGESGGNNTASSNSATKVKSVSVHMFWETLLDNLRAMIREQDSMPSHAVSQMQQAAGQNQAASDSLVGTIIANQETGVIAIKANEKQHEELRKYINNVVEHASRQVLIEATIIEVELKDDYQAGIDWSVVANDGKFTFNQNLQNIISSASNVTPATMLAYKGSEILAAVKVLDTFGNARVLSSPKLMVLNNQTAILKVVDNHVYFTTTAQQAQSVQGSVLSTIETELHTVPVGLVMSVTPQINQNDQVIIHARPTVSRIASEVRDPNPLLESVPSLIPVIQVREMESILKVSSGEIGVLGGLMENAINNETRGTPGVNKVSYLDNLFSFKTSQTRKTELVVFLRPRVIRNASLKGELNDFKGYLENEPVKFAVPEFK